MYQVHDWAEVRRLHREGRSIKQTAEQLGMSRTTVYRLLSLRDPPHYVRESRASLLDPFREQIASLLDEDERAPATVILERLRERGYAGGITILKDHLARIRPEFLAARAYQGTTYLAGEILQLDWWQPPLKIAVGLGHERQVYGLVATLPHSALMPASSPWARPWPILGPPSSAAWCAWEGSPGPWWPTTTPPCCTPASAASPASTRKSPLCLAI